MLDLDDPSSADRPLAGRAPGEPPRSARPAGPPAEVLGQLTVKTDPALLALTQSRQHPLVRPQTREHLCPAQVTYRPALEADQRCNQVRRGLQPEELFPRRRDGAP